MHVYNLCVKSIGSYNVLHALHFPHPRKRNVEPRPLPNIRVISAQYIVSRVIF